MTELGVCFSPVLRPCFEFYGFMWSVKQVYFMNTFVCQSGLGKAACSDNAATCAGAISTSMLHQRWQSRLLHSKELLCACVVMKWQRGSFGQLVFRCWHCVRYKSSACFPEW